MALPEIPDNYAGLGRGISSSCFYSFQMYMPKIFDCRKNGSPNWAALLHRTKCKGLILNMAQHQSQHLLMNHNDRIQLQTPTDRMLQLRLLPQSSTVIGWRECPQIFSNQEETDELPYERMTGTELLKCFSEVFTKCAYVILLKTVHGW